MSGIKSIREYALYERVVMRILFAWVVLKATPARLSFTKFQRLTDLPGC
jgi:hypothetical protein